jgi:hypothetical protein
LNAPATPRRRSEDCLAARQQASPSLRSAPVVTEGRHDLGAYHLVNHLDAWNLRQAGGDLGRPRAQLVDEGSQAVTDQAAQGGPDGETAGPPGELGNPTRWITRPADQVVRLDTEDGYQRRRVPHQRDPTVVGHVHGLVRVGGPGVGCVHALGQVAQPRAGGGPEAKRAVHVHPYVVAARDFDRVGEGIEGTAVHLAGLKADDRRPGPGFKDGGEPRRLEPALAVGGYFAHGALTESQETGRPVDGVVPVPAHRDPDSGRLEKSLLIDVPTVPNQNRLTGSRKRRVVGHHSAGDQSDRRTER